MEDFIQALIWALKNLTIVSQIIKKSKVLFSIHSAGSQQMLFSVCLHEIKEIYIDEQRGRKVHKEDTNQKRKMAGMRATCVMDI